MSRVIGVRRETKSPWERRVPLTPDGVQRLVAGNKLPVVVQTSSRRVFPDSDFVHAGATVSNDISAADVIFGVKEIPCELLEQGKTYLYFSHVIKGQVYNMGMLQRLLDLGCTLIDYEKISDENDRRLIFFGRYAGLAGMIDALWALGKRLRQQRHETPFAQINPSHEYANLEEAKAAVRAAGRLIADKGLPMQLAPLVVGVTGYGNVAQGVQEILAQLPTREVSPAELQRLTDEGTASARCVYRVTFKEEDQVSPCDPEHQFELQDYYQRPERYESVFSQYLSYLTVLMNCNYWDDRYPRLVPNQDLASLWNNEQEPRLKLIGDLACDIGGSVECTYKCTGPGDPVYLFDPASGRHSPGLDGDGVVVLAVEILPAELPRDASEAFSEALMPFVPAIARADYSVPFEQLNLPPELLKAVIVYRGKLTPDYRYLEAHLL